MSVENPKSIKDLRPGDRFVLVETQKPYIKCDHVITLSDLRKIDTAVGLYDGSLTMIRDDEIVTVVECSVASK